MFWDDMEMDWNLKIFRHINGTTVYTKNKMFTEIQNQIALPQNMDDDEIMTAETPISYTFKDGE